MSKQARALWLVAVLLVLALPAMSRGNCGIQYSVLWPPLDSFVQHDTIPTLGVVLSNISQDVEVIGDTFRIWDGVAHVSSPLQLEPLCEVEVDLHDWVRDGQGSLPPDPPPSDNGFQISTSGADDYSGAGFDGQNYLVCWTCRISENIVGARITQAGHVLDHDGITVYAPQSGARGFSQVASDGEDYLVVWEDKLDYYNISIRAARVSPTGAVLDPVPLDICENTGIPSSLTSMYAPAVAFEGGSYLITWVGILNGHDAIFGCTVTPEGVVQDLAGPIDATSYDKRDVAVAAGHSGFMVVESRQISSGIADLIGVPVGSDGTSVGEPFVISGHTHGILQNLVPSVSYCGSGYEVAWNGNRETQYQVTDIWGQSVSQAGTLLGNAVCILRALTATQNGYYPKIQPDGFTQLVVWSDRRFDTYGDVYGRRLNSAGELIGSEIPISAQPGITEKMACVVHGDSNFLTAWTGENNDIYGELLDAAFVPYDATYPSTGRHLARAPNRSDVNWVWDAKIGFFDSYRGVMGTYPPFYVGSGKWPTIATNWEGLSWTASVTNDAVDCFVQRPDGSWRELPIPAAGVQNAPSLLLSRVRSMVDQCDMGYVVYVTSPPGQHKDQVCFAAFDSLGVYYAKVIDEVSNLEGEGIFSSSIAVTPGDFFHVVWTKNGGYGTRVYYDGTRYPLAPGDIRQGIQPIWWGATRISLPLPQHDEPATHCFVEAEGQNIYANWRGPNALGVNIGEIWQRRGKIEPSGAPQWWPLYNVSQSPDLESDCPSMSTSHAVVWQESWSTGPVILGRVDDQLVELGSVSGSRYPHANVLPVAPRPPGTSRLTAVWTEGEPGSAACVVKIGDYYFPSSPGPNPPALEVTCGSAQASPFCLHRDGFDSTGLLPIDYSGMQLAYRLPYLNPQKYYLMEAVAYQTTATTGQEQFVLPGCGTWNLTVRPNIPETLRIVMPPGSHDSCATTLWINRISGLRATLAGVKLYEYEVVPAGGGGQSGKINPLQVPKELILEQSWPNPATRTLTIGYGIPKATNVSLNVYDITGKLIRTLETNDKVKPGYYNINWNCRDSRDREVAGGIYFYRLVTSDMLQTSSGEPAARVKTRKLLIAR
jgi:hypothetical protein